MNLCFMMEVKKLKHVIMSLSTNSSCAILCHRLTDDSQVMDVSGERERGTGTARQQVMADPPQMDDLNPLIRRESNGTVVGGMSGLKIEGVEQTGLYAKSTVQTAPSAVV